jgi:inosine/xanthosine triphosphatase
MAEAAPAPLQVVVGSKNPVKLAAVRQAFFRAFPDRYIAFAGRDVPSGVRDQPWGHEETWKGATQRARGALLAETGADYAVGIEGGVVQAGDGLRSVAYVAIRRSRDMRGSLEHTASFKLPPRVARLLFGQEPGHGKLELGAACDLVFNETNSKRQGGTVGALTRGLIDRTTYYEHAVVCALAPFLHDDSGLYNRTAPVPAPPAPAPAPSPVAPPAAPPPAPPSADDDDFELVAVLSPEQRSAESRKRAEREGDIIDLLADDDDDDGAKLPGIATTPAWYFQDLHLQERRIMITNIARLLQARKPNATADWMQRLPQMARRLEESLFRSATSFEEYRDTSTLKKRLQALAIAMGLRARQQQQAGPAPAAAPPPPRPAGPAAAKRARAAPDLTTDERAAVVRAIAELDRKSSQKAVRKSAERILGLPDGTLDAKKEAVKQVCAEEMRRLEQQWPPRRRSARLE